MPTDVPFGTRHRIRWPMRRRSMRVTLASWFERRWTKHRAQPGAPTPLSGSMHARPSSSGWTVIGRCWSGSSRRYRPIVGRRATSVTTPLSATAEAARPRRRVNRIAWSTDRSSSRRSRLASPAIPISSSLARAPCVNIWSDTSAMRMNGADGRATSAARPRRGSPTRSSWQDCATRRAWTRDDGDQPGVEEVSPALGRDDDLRTGRCGGWYRRPDPGSCRGQRASYDWLGVFSHPSRPDNPVRSFGIEQIGCPDRSIC